MVSPLFETLVVEDDPFFRQVIVQAVAQVRANCRIHYCETAVDAQTIASQKGSHFDLILLDLGLPDAPGLEVLNMLHERFPASPIMVITISSDEDQVLKAIQHGASGYILKGDMHLSIAKAIEQLLAGIHPISPILAGYFLRLAGKAPQRSIQHVAKLTKKERELLEFFAKGYSYSDAAQAMGVALSTVQTHTRNLYRKLQVRSGLQALSKAKESGLLQ